MFITFEGGEGSGKTSLIKAVAAWLDEKGLKNISTREPGGSFVAEQIRNILLDVKNKELSYKTEALLFAASRAQHLDEIIIPALSEDKIVLCDRFIDSSLAYQGHARGIGFETILKINHFAVQWMPDYTIYIDVNPELGLQRAGSRGSLNRLDLETLNFHKKVREGYLELSKMYPLRYIIIDGNCDLDTLISTTLEKLKEVFA